MPPSGIRRSNGRVELADDSGDPASQRRRDSTASTSTERSNHCADDTSRDDHVLERHHAVLVRAQTLHHFNVKLQHMRNFLLLAVRLRWLRTSQPLIGKTCSQLGSNMLP